MGGRLGLEPMHERDHGRRGRAGRRVIRRMAARSAGGQDCRRDQGAQVSDDHETVERPTW
jgi:hypothetical protein